MHASGRRGGDTFRPDFETQKRHLKRVARSRFITICAVTAGPGSECRQTGTGRQGRAHRHEQRLRRPRVGAQPLG